MSKRIIFKQLVCFSVLTTQTYPTQVLFWVLERQKWGKFLQYLSTNTAKEIVHKESSSNSPASSPIGSHAQHGHFFPRHNDDDDDNDVGKKDAHLDDGGIELKI